MLQIENENACQYSEACFPGAERPHWDGFIVGERQLPQKIAKLVDVPFGSSGFVAKIKLEPLEVKRLEDLGLRHGAPIKILEGGKDDSILIGAGDARVGVNYKVATHIYVYLEK